MIIKIIGTLRIRNITFRLKKIHVILNIVHRFESNYVNRDSN